MASKRPGIIEVEKSDSKTGKVLQGVQFELTNSKGTWKKTGVTDQEGKLTFSLLKLNEQYTLTEVATIDGYQLGTNVSQNIILDINNKKKTVQITNDPIQLIPVGTGKITIKVFDSKTGINLSGAQFEILDGSGNVIKTSTTDDKGEIIFDGLEIDRKYTIKQIKDRKSVV